MSKSYCEHGTLWISASQLAREYNKHRVTILRWIEDGFILQLGYRVKRDPSGRWFVGKLLQ